MKEQVSVKSSIENPFFGWMRNTEMRIWRCRDHLFNGRLFQSSLCRSAFEGILQISRIFTVFHTGESPLEMLGAVIEWSNESCESHDVMLISGKKLFALLDTLLSVCHLVNAIQTAPTSASFFSASRFWQTSGRLERLPAWVAVGPFEFQ